MSDPQNTPKNRLPYVLSVVATLAAALLLRSEGRLWWCKSGDLAPYVADAWNSSHTSQHFFDPYTFTHILHGVMFFWIASLIFGRISADWRFLIAVAAECGWELVENSAWIIEKYRANTASLDYFGDSVLNSVGDIVACATGFLVARRLGAWKSLAFFVAVELFLIIWIRDSLVLNIVMLAYPIDFLKRWQAGQ